MTWKPPAPGALDDTQWPEKLVAHAVERERDDDRLHGYAVLQDVCRHYRHSDLIFLGITGELPDARASSLFHVALCAFATPTVGEAAVHLGALGRICGGTLASALGAGLIALADQARHQLDAHQDLLAWFMNPTDAVPGEFCNPDSAGWTNSLLQAAGPCRLVRREMSRDAARLALLFEAGLHDRDKLEAAIVASSLVGLVAEVLTTGPADLKLYPVKLPPFQYVEGG